MENQNRKMLLGILFLTVLGIAAVAANLGINIAQGKRYAPVQATLVEVVTSAGNINHSESSRHTTGYYTFEFDGKIWEASRRELFKNKGDIGTQYEIRCNPVNPHQLEDVASRTLMWAVLGILVLCAVMLIYGIGHRP